MDRATTLFWSLIVLLVGASLFFGIHAEQQRRSVQRGGGSIDNGDLVRLVRVIDGDSLQAARNGQEPVIIRLVGIRAFDAKVEKDVVSPFARAAVETLQRNLQDRPARVLLNATPKDRRGRYLATLYADDQDVALRLVSQGLVLVYTVYPFPNMQLYLQAQELARAGRRGLWSNAEATERALALMREWRSKTE